MILRRTFLAAAGGALTLPLVRKFEWFIEQYEKPLLEAPAHAEATLYVGWRDWEEGELTLGIPEDDVPEITWRELFEKWSGEGTLSEDDLGVACFDHKVDPARLDMACDHPDWPWLWQHEFSAQARAYDLLESFELGPELRGAEGELGKLEFTSMALPGSPYRGVAAADALTCSLLQHRLNELGARIEVKMV